MDRDTKRLLKQAERDKRLADLYRQLPALQAVDEELSLAGREGLLAVWGGGDLVDVHHKIATLQEKKAAILAGAKLDEGVYDVNWDCPICQDRGYRLPGQPCMCTRRDEGVRRRLESGLTPLQKTMTFDSFSLEWYDHPQEVQHLVEEVKRFARHVCQGKPCENLFLFGPVGNGKTHLCSAVANQLLASGKTVIYRRAEELIVSLREEMYGKGERSESYSLPDRLLQADLLILEDLGAERLTDFAEEQLVGLVDQRLGWQKPWLITSHLVGDKFSGRYDIRLVDRVLGESKRLYLKENSIRYKRARQGK